MIEIRVASPSDAPVIALLARVTFTESFGHLFSDHKDLLNYFQNTFSVNKIRSGLEKDNNLFWIAFADQLPVGYAKLKLKSRSGFLSSSKAAQLQKIYVLKDFLSLKIGYQLQSKLITKAKEKQAEAIWLSVWEENERAINFYRKNDFQEIGHHTFQIGKEVFGFLAMSKSLQDI